MSRATESELALLKLISSSIIHIVGDNDILFVAPYLVEYEDGKMAKLRMPALDHPFNCFMGDGDDKAHNETLWKKFHEEGRMDKSSSIWTHILESDTDTNLSDIGILDKSLDLDQLKTIGEEFRPLRKNNVTTCTAIVSEVKQSSKHIIAVISVVLGPLVDVTPVKDKIKNYLTFLQSGSYLNLQKELAIAKASVRDWHAFRNLENINHISENDYYFNSFIIKAPKPFVKDFGNGDLNQANRPISHSGRPSLKDLSQTNSECGRIKRVIKDRINAVFQDSFTNFSITVNAGEYDYLWFNALALADTFANAISAYNSLSPELDTKANVERMFLSKTTPGKHSFVNCIVDIKQSEAGIDAFISIHENGLVGNELRIDTRGNHLSSIAKCATLSGADSLYAQWVDMATGQLVCERVLSSSEDTWGVGGKISERINGNNVPKNLPKGLTGFFFQIQGKLNCGFGIVDCCEGDLGNGG
ncbi:hypothetical protein [Methylobacter sp.]|uniref:hypothetical protein n=1 Tax=Methylobacter sp. TaxID=2051955 RepID=UPI002FDE6094